MTPRWLRRRPLMLAGLLSLTNRFRRSKVAWGVLVGLIAVFVWVVTRPSAATALTFAADRAVLFFVGGAIHAATSVARRKHRAIADVEKTWLGALPYRVSVPSRVIFALVIQLLALGLLCAGIAVASSVSWAVARTAWLGVCGGYAVGALSGWFPQLLFPVRASNTAGSQYAIVRKIREHWAIAPRLDPLAYWAVAWARALNNPQVSARSMLIVLVGIPMGTPGEVALASAAGWMVGLYIVLNLAATVRTAFAAAWWLAPTPVPFWPFATAVISRALLLQAGVLAAGIVAVAALEQSRWMAIALGAAIAWLLLFTGISLLACALATRHAASPRRWFR